MSRAADLSKRISEAKGKTLKSNEIPADIAGLIKALGIGDRAVVVDFGKVIEVEVKAWSMSPKHLGILAKTKKLSSVGTESGLIVIEMDK